MESLFVSIFMYTAAYSVENSGDLLAFVLCNIK